jgi:hypothetical protein
LLLLVGVRVAAVAQLVLFMVRLFIVLLFIVLLFIVLLFILLEELLHTLLVKVGILGHFLGKAKLLEEDCVLDDD